MPRLLVSGEERVRVVLALVLPGEFLAKGQKILVVRTRGRKMTSVIAPCDGQVETLASALAWVSPGDVLCKMSGPGDDVEVMCCDQKTPELTEKINDIDVILKRANLEKEDLFGPPAHAGERGGVEMAPLSSPLQRPPMDWGGLVLVFGLSALVIWVFVHQDITPSDVGNAIARFDLHRAALAMKEKALSLDETGEVLKQAALEGFEGATEKVGSFVRAGFEEIKVSASQASSRVSDFAQTSGSVVSSQVERSAQALSTQASFVQDTISAQLASAWKVASSQVSSAWQVASTQVASSQFVASAPLDTLSDTLSASWN